MSAAAARRDARWARAAAEHRGALERVLAAIAGVEPGRWGEAGRGGGWSPAQVAEHLALTYQRLLDELEGRGAMRLVLGAGRRKVLRWFLLPHILFHRSFPLRARAPRELRPSDQGLTQAEAGTRLAELGRRWEETVLSAPERDRLTATHPYFGPVPLLQAFRFCTVHLEHHRRQLIGR